MKLLSVMFTAHDCNMTYYDGANVHYHKLERSKQIKRYAWEDHTTWIADLKNLWNVILSDIDEIAVCLTYTNDPYNPLSELITTGSYFPSTDIRNVFSKDELWWLSHPNVTYLNHHYCHALSTWMLADNPDISFVIDGLGDARTWSVFKDDKLIDAGHIENVGSIGWAMRESGFDIGLQANHYNDIAGKLMGLQSYGSIDQGYLSILKNQNYTIKDVYDIFSPENWISYKGDKLLAKLTKLDHIKTVHYFMEDVLVDFFKQYANPTDVISYSGGVAQNVIWNTKLRNHFPNIVIPPHSSDEGLSLGGLEFLRRKHNLPKFKLDNFPYVAGDCAPDTIPSLETIKYAAKLLAEGNTVGWYQGNGEVGPRALGNRSILMNPNILNGRDKINLIKNREHFRPFGASVLKDHVSEYFDTNLEDPFMLYVANTLKPGLESITHVDGTCRIQTVDDRNSVYKQLLEEFYALTGLPVLLNTSLNVAGKPIAGYPENARELFYNAKLDYMFIGNECLTRSLSTVTNKIIIT
jgi:carbamoyltransferase